MPHIFLYQQKWQRNPHALILATDMNHKKIWTGYIITIHVMDASSKLMGGVSITTPYLRNGNKLYPQLSCMMQRHLSQKSEKNKENEKLCLICTAMKDNVFTIHKVQMFTNLVIFLQYFGECCEVQGATRSMHLIKML